jgi:hypothetical protein
MQYVESTHRVGGNFERAYAPCNVCHTHQGFIELLATGAGPTGNVSDPAPVNCRTCHQIHKTYTAADYALTSTAAFTLQAGGATVDLGPGSGNLCGQCHQARSTSPMPAVGGPNVTVTSSRYGWHYSPVTQVIAGRGAFEFAGSYAPKHTGPDVHGQVDKNPKLCANCHMSEGYGVRSGGHTFKMGYEGTNGALTPNVTSCQACHGDRVANFDYGNLQSQTKGLLDQIGDELTRIGIRRPGTHYAVAGSYPGDVAAGFLNWYMFLEDKSFGVHNPLYTKYILSNTLETLKKY